MCYKVLNYKKEHVFQENGGGRMCRNMRRSLYT